MEDKESIIESLVEKAEAYGKTSINLIKLKAVDTSADVASSMMANIGVLTVFILFIVILSVGAALWIGDALGKASYGFFIVAGFYALLTLVLLLFKKQLIKEPLNNSIISNFLK